MNDTPHHRFLDALAARDWDRLSDELAETMEWHGPAGDRTHRGRDYIERLRGSVGRFDDYQIDVVREVGDDNSLMVELVQQFTSGGEHHVVPEVMVFDVDPANGRITRLVVYVRGIDKEPVGVRADLPVTGTPPGSSVRTGPSGRQGNRR